MHRLGDSKPPMQSNNVRKLVHKQAIKVLNEQLLPRWLEMTSKRGIGQLNIDDVFLFNYAHKDSVAKSIFYQICKSLKCQKL